MRTLKKRLDSIRALFGWTADPAPDFLRLRALAGLLPKLPPDSPNASTLAAFLAKNPEDVTWDEIHAAELALVAVMPIEMLQARFGNLVDEYKTVTEGEPFVNGKFHNSSKTWE